MKDFELGAIQERFADIVWEHEPIASGELAKICEKELSWKRPTTYTVLRKLCEKGLLQNKDGIVTSLVPREEFYSAKSEQIIEDSFKGSLPAFIAAFISKKNISAEEADEIQKMIDAFKRRADHEHCFSQNIEYEHYRKLVDPGGCFGKAALEKSAEMDPLPSVGTSRYPARLPVLVWEYFQFNPK